MENPYIEEHPEDPEECDHESFQWVVDSIGEVGEKNKLILECDKCRSLFTEEEAKEISPWKEEGTLPAGGLSNKQ